MLTKLYKRIRYSKTFLGMLHILAMNAPHDRLSVMLYRLRGTRIGKCVYIDRGVFIETWKPDHVEIKDNVEIGPKAMIIATDSSYNHIFTKIPIIYKKVIIEKNVYIGAGAIILPGITIGEFSIIGAGSVVTRNVPPRSLVVGIPGRIIKSVDKGLLQHIDNKLRITGEDE